MCSSPVTSSFLTSHQGAWVQLPGVTDGLVFWTSGCRPWGAGICAGVGVAKVAKVHNRV